MSAYVVNNAVINRILQGLNYSGYRGSFGLWSLGYDWLKALERAQGSHADQEELGHELYEINLESVRYRYDDSDLDNLPGTIDQKTGKCPAPYEYENIPAPDIFQLYKDLGCWIYQSCESETCRNDPVYKAIESFKHLVADTIISNMKEYENAGWDA